MSFFSVLCRLAVALWVGGAALFTFVLTPTIFRTETRDVAGRIVGYLFPGYFRWGLACGAVALLALLLARGKNWMPAAVLLVVMLAVTAFQAFHVEPKAALIKQQIPSFETTPKDHPMRREFSKLHGISAVCNLSVIAGGVVLIILL
ncbi:hypothetical protein GeomeDRAFT_3240 [Geobacter metallireducens RCH3]|uniref:Membrane protein, putative n=1 Tax=Geobacter metallireducens (strain ATCC 53774 / DSM 7210 / GS-15) TaxID=269799 RepID=Q39XR7_GEOMG|nr:DUF4149 domain-containing protein [Geobacter metallireducens]ABB30957.1 membrane protein, putative [Geobacter metallireducens GS-15]EHP84135.1 hypothetical protein GeomeDRAFT_3240 [Geobacter metallireducens RCH3]